MDDPARLDSLFHAAVTALDAGDRAGLERMLAAHPELLHTRLDSPGAWLRDKVGAALEDFFERPYLLWFVAEDPVRNGRLPANIAQIARVIIEAAQRACVGNLREQLDYTLRLVAWSTIARNCGVQIELLDALLDAGASPDRTPDNALVNGNIAAAEHLVRRGAALTLGTALCFGRWEDVSRLAPPATPREKQFGFVLSALNGKAEALSRMITLGVDLNGPSTDLFAHATPLHHAVSSGSLESVKVLVEAGATLTAKDTAWNGTPLGWAEHLQGEHERDARGAHYAAIATYLRDAEHMRK
jgi:peptide-methionine (S)-S-oxide reductase